MRDVKDTIKKLGSGTEMSPQVTYMKDNIQKVLASRLQDVGNRFRRDQLRYQSGAFQPTVPGFSLLSLSCFFSFRNFG